MKGRVKNKKGKKQTITKDGPKKKEKNQIRKQIG